ncbi:cytochrome c oxidase assembly protein [Streptomyces sp. MMG1533]|uniref:cytochrome c oxidase assembly protein n=1 Tax=Streptomyces sp. MMG1533 TaxID=1415546 RepID=UPI0006AF87A6|nr:cytochrome c oxidase assembly protein [Streptomyces sp. MMG1533]
MPAGVVMTHGTLIAGAWYLNHAPSWAPDRHHDQQLGGGAVIGFAELVALPFLLAVLVQWDRTERAETTALDRRPDAELVPAGSSATGPRAGAGPRPFRGGRETENSDVAQRIRQQRPGR